MWHLGEQAHLTHSRLKACWTSTNPPECVPLLPQPGRVRPGCVWPGLVQPGRIRPGGVRPVRAVMSCDTTQLMKSLAATATTSQSEVEKAFDKSPP